MGAAHGHGIRQLIRQLADVGCHALLAAAIDHGDEGTADENAVRPQCQCLEHIQPCADAAVHQHHDPVAHGVGNGGQHLRRGGTLIQHPAAVVGHHDGGGPGLHRLLRPTDGHNALEDEGLSGVLRHLTQLRHGLAAGRRHPVAEEGQTGGIDVHGDGHGIGGQGQVQLLHQGLPVPGLHRRHTAALLGPDGLRGALHHRRVHTIAGEGHDACLSTGRQQQPVIGQIVVLISVVQLHGAHRSRHHRQGQPVAEEVEGRVGGTVFPDGIQIHPQLLPLLIVPGKAGAGAFGAWAGDGIFTRLTVAHGTRLAVGSHTGAGVLQNFLIFHMFETSQRLMGLFYSRFGRFSRHLKPFSAIVKNDERISVSNF